MLQSWHMLQSACRLCCFWKCTALLPGHCYDLLDNGLAYPTLSDFSIRTILLLFHARSLPILQQALLVLVKRPEDAQPDVATIFFYLIYHEASKMF